MEELERLFRERLQGYHIDISLYPSGGLIDVSGCEECGTDESIMESVSWRFKRGETMESALRKIESKLNSK